MKKTLICLLSLAGLISTSCDKKDGEASLTQTNSYNAYSLVIPSTGTPSICKTTYSFVFDLMKNNCKVKCDNLIVGGSTVGFTSSDVPYYTGSVTVDNRNFQVILVSGREAGDNLKNLRAEITLGSLANNATLINSLNNQLSGDPLTLPASGVPCPYLYMQYDYGTNIVRTFWNDLLFEGTTATEYPGLEGHYDTDDITYRVKMKLDDTGNKKADVYFYNAKFAAEQPQAVNFVLQDLDLEFGSNGYTISGTNVVPVLVPEDTPFSRYTFDNIRIQSTPTMNQINCVYQVAGIYSGRFQGDSYILVKTNGI